MKFSGIVSSTVAAAVLSASWTAAADASAVDPIVIKGKHFFYKTNGTEFFLRGVAYQPDYIANASAATNANYTDPLMTLSSCQRDIPYLLQLSTNVIRTYALDPTVDHSDCMNALAEAGIYVISDLSSPEQSINRDDPAWTTSLYARYTAVVDEMSKYNNVIGFFAGNEVSNDYNTTAASAYVKAAVRDTKAYIAAQGYRTMYVGYASYDGDIRSQLADYFNCGDQADAIDFWGYNVYSWCGDSNYIASGYDLRTEFFTNYSVPAFFAEYGCNTAGPRLFTEVQALYGSQMTGVWSGGIVYQYFQEINNFGLVQVIDSSSVSPLPDFTVLSSQMASATPAMTPASLYNPTTLQPQPCPTQDASWSAIPTPLPPPPNAALCECMVNTLTCVVKNSSSPDVYGAIFDYACRKDPNACTGIYHNGSTGVYGAYSGCEPDQTLSYVMDVWYVDHISQPDPCDFSGNATMTSPASATGTCATLLEAAGTNGGGSVPSPTGTPTYSNTATPAGNNAVTSGGAATSGAAATGAGTSATTAASAAASSGAASIVGVQRFDLTMLHLGVYVFCAVATGAGMILL